MKKSLKYRAKKLRNILIDSFHCCPDLPKGLKKKNSCSKIWLIDQLYIKLGCNSKNAHSSKDIWEIMIFVKSLHFVCYILVLVYESLFQELSKSFKNQLGNVSKVDVLEEIWLRTFWSYNDKEVIVIGNCRVISTLIWDVNLWDLFVKRKWIPCLGKT